jgi:1-deoxy-D-xylulose-5-phosphate synthase
MDVALHHAGVTFVLDRAGITGDDGPSHNGMWDLAMLRIIPGLQLAAPRDEPTLRAALRAAVDIDDGPSVVRYPKGALVDPIPALRDLDGVDIVAEHAPATANRRVLVVGVGSMVGTALATAQSLAAHGIAATVAAPTWVLPIPSGLVKLSGEHDLVLTIEDGLADGGIGAALGQRCAEAGILTPAIHLGVPQRFLAHASREEIIAESRLTAADATRDVLDALALL